MIYLLLIIILLVLSVIDERSRMVPEGISLLGILIALNFHALVGTTNLAILGLTIGFFSTWFISQTSLIKLGGGDAKVIGFIGAWIGWQIALGTLILSILIYKCFFNQRRQIAFVPIILEGFSIISVGALLCRIVKLF